MLASEAGKPAWHNEGFAGWRAKYDEHGNEIERAFIDEDGKPTRNKDDILSIEDEVLGAFGETLGDDLRVSASGRPWASPGSVGRWSQTSFVELPWARTVVVPRY